MMRKLGVALLLVWALSGCDCGNEPESTRSITITAPADGSTLTLADDLRPDVEGLQIDVQGRTSGFQGTPAAQLLLDGTATPSVTALAADGTFLFEDATIPAGAHVLAVSIDGIEAMASVVVDETPVPQPLVIIAPVEGTLNAQTDGAPESTGLQTTVRVRSAMLSGGTLRLCLAAEGFTGPGACKSAEGQLLAEAPLAEGAVTAFEVTLPDGVGERLSAEHESASGDLVASPAVTLTVDTIAPTVEILSPANGAVLTEQSFDVVVSTDAGAGKTVRVQASSPDGEPVAGEAIVGDDGRATVAMNVPTGAQTLTASVEDDAGNPGSAQIAVFVDVQGCAVVILEPPSLDFVFNTLNSQVSGTTGTYEIVGTTNCPEAEIRFAKTVDGVVSQQGPTTAGADGSFRFAATFEDGETDGQLQITAEAGHAPNDGATLHYDADFTAPTVRIVSPLDGQLLDQPTVVVEVEVEGAEGQSVAVTPSPDGTQGTATVEAGHAFVTVGLVPGATTLEASVTDPAGNPATSDPVAVHVDFEGCDVAVTSPAAWPFAFNSLNSQIVEGSSPLSATHTISGTSNLCPDGQVFLAKVVDGVRTDLGSAAVGPDGSFEITAALQDGEADGQLIAYVRRADFAENDGLSLGYLADFTPPSIDSVLPALGNLSVVNAGNTHLLAGEPGYVADADPAAAGGQLDVQLAFQGAGSIASTGEGSLEISTASASLVSQQITSNDSQSFNGRLDLTERYDGPVTITLTDAAGNLATASWDVLVATATLPVPSITMPTPGSINIAHSIGGDRETYALVQGRASFDSEAPAGTQLYFCSTVALPGSGPCELDGMFELPGSRVAANGTAAVISELQLPQGQQDLYAVLSDGVGGVSGSAPIAVSVDTVPPEVTNLVAVEDANPQDGYLSEAETPDGRLHFRAEITGADGRSASLYKGAQLLKAATVTDGVATFELVGVLDGPLALSVKVSDLAGNPNYSTTAAPPIQNAAAFLNVTVRRIAPSISVVSPSFTACNIARDTVDPATPECELGLTVLVGSGATRVEFGGPGNPSPAVATSFTNGRATAAYTVPTGGPHALTATVFDVAGNSRSTTLSMTVDTEAPTLAFVHPHNNDVYASQQVPLELSSNAEEGQTVTVISNVNGAVIARPLVQANGTASVVATVPFGAQTLVATVTDAAGNPSPAASVAIDISMGGCDIDFTNPSDTNVLLNAQKAPGGTLRITGQTTKLGCESQPIVFYAKVGADPEAEVARGTTAADGTFETTFTFAHGSSTTFTAKMDYGAAASAFFVALADIEPPVISISAPTPDANSALFVVAQEGNVNVRDHVPGYEPDADSADGAQLDLHMTVTDGASVDGNSEGTLTIMQGATELVSRPVSDNGTVSLDPLRLLLEQPFTGKLTIKVEDAAHNVSQVEWDLSVDVVRPEPPVVVTVDPDNGHYTSVIDERHADVDVWLLARSDEGPTGIPSSWVLGYTNGTRLGTATLDDAAFDDAAITTVVSLPAPGPRDSEQLVELRAIAPLNVYQLVPRAIDALGNRSEIVPTEMRIMWSKETLTYSGGQTTGAYFGAYTATGDVDADGIADLAVSAWADSGNIGSAKVFYGGALPPVRSQPFAGAAANAYFGAPIGLIDINGDGHAELIARNGAKLDVHSWNAATSLLSSTPWFSFTPSASLLQELPDMNGDGLGELAIGAPTVSSNSGKLYVFLSGTDWSSVIQSGTVALDTADIVVSGDASSRLTGGNGLAAIPNLLGPGQHGLLVGAYGANKAYVFSAQTLVQRGRAATSADALQVLSFTGTTRFGYSVVTVDTDADGLDDAVIGDPYRNTVYVFKQTSPGAFSNTGTVFARGTGNFGWSLARGDLNLDGSPDLAIGANTTSATTLSLFWSGTEGLSLPAGTTITGDPSFSYTLRIADLDNDQSLDLIVGEFAYENGSVEVFH